jgi:hypothetical protein
MGVPNSVLLLFAVASIVALWTPNPLLTAASVLVWPLFILLLWRRSEPPVLLYAISFQWVQVTATVFHADALGMTLREFSPFPFIREAIGLSLVALVVLAVGMRIGLSALSRTSSRTIRDEVEALSIHRVAVAYVCAVVFSSSISYVAWIVPQLTQILLSLSLLKWAFFFLFGYLVMIRGERYGLFSLAVLYEFLAGIGFFAGFKTVLFVAVLCFLGASFRLDVRTLLKVSVVAVLIAVLGALWYSIRPEFRPYLRQGATGQVVRVSWTEQISKFGQLASEVDGEDLIEAAAPAAERMAYVKFFAATMERVPRQLPHEDGALWGQSITHILKPRIFFPNKPPLPSESARTIKYTGLSMAGREQGTSISLGYVPESYVDFGPYWMFLPILLLGVGWGGLYSVLVSSGPLRVIGFAFAVAVLIHANKFEISTIKLLGSVVMKFIVLALFLRFIMPRLVPFLFSSAERPDLVSYSFPSPFSPSHRSVDAEDAHS